MKKKLFTLLTLLCLCVTGAWGGSTSNLPTSNPSSTYSANVTKYELSNEAPVVANNKIFWASRGSLTINTSGLRPYRMAYALEVTGAAELTFTVKCTTNSSRTITGQAYKATDPFFNVWKNADAGQQLENYLKTVNEKNVNDMTDEEKAIHSVTKLAAVTSSSDNNKKMLICEDNFDNTIATASGDDISHSCPSNGNTNTFKVSLSSAGKYVIFLTSSGSGVAISSIEVSPILTGAWTPSSGSIYVGDAVPTPTFSVTNDPEPAASAYKIVYSLKEGSDDGVVTIPTGGASYTLNNNTVGTATIVATLTSTNTSNYLDAAKTYEYSYEVKAKSPWMALTQESITLKSTPVQRAATANVTLTGGFLTDGTYDVATTADGLSILPTTFTVESGEVDQAFTVTYNKDIATSGSENITFSDGTTSKVLTVNYSSIVPHEWATVSGATTWDWTKLTGSDTQLTTNTTPKNTDEFLLGDMNGEILTQDVGYDPATFNADALKLIAQYVVRSKQYAQATQVKFKTSVPGTVKVNYSNTGGSRPYRHIEVNGVLSAEGSASATAKDTEEIPVSAGEVIIKVYIPDATSPQAGNNDVVGYSMARFYKIVFTPLSGENKDVVNVTDVDYATYVTTADIDFEKTDGVKAYKVINTSPITYEEVNAAPTGTPLLIAAESKSYILKAADVTPADVTGNLLEASDGTNITGDGSTVYVLGKKDNKAVWGLLKDGNKLSAGKAALTINDGGGAKAYYEILIGGETTGIANLNVNDNANIDANAPMYNLAGQRVNKSYKGVVIVNGKKMLNK